MPIKSHMTQAEIADLVGCTQQYVSKRVAEAGLKKNKQGYDLREVLHLIFKNRDTDRLNDAKTRRAEAEAESAELDLLAKKNELIPLSDAQELIRKPYAPIASFLQTLAYKIAPKCVGLTDEMDVVKIATEEIDRCQTKLKTELAKLVD